MLGMAKRHAVHGGSMRLKRKLREEGTEPMPVVGYVRVSTDRQAEKGVSLDAQRAKLAAYAQLYGLNLVAIVGDEGASGTTINRPGLHKALNMLKAGEAEALLVVKLDRLVRSLYKLGKLLEEYFSDGRWSLLSVGENIDTRTPGGRLVLNVLGSVAQWETETISLRISEALQFKIKKGGAVGGPAPYGFRKVGTDIKTLDSVGEEQAIIQEARRLRASGLSLRKVSKALEVNGHLSRDGSRFHPQQIARMVA